ncbi:MAG: TetR/AcrR family transcriptional regulator C-terminal domain-containing protein [Deltaproteobacteria bacterium]|nr:TetR/AcrR family transcriptional regulator C-terminal domain-containing protein [Deltaproteobacteria bacterium]
MKKIKIILKFYFQSSVLQVIEEGKKEKAIRKEIDPYILRDIILGTIEHFAIRGFILGRFPNLSEAGDHLYDQIVGGVA